MGNQIVLAPEAEQDRNEVVAYIAKDNPGERIATKRNNTKRVCYLLRLDPLHFGPVKANWATAGKNSNSIMRTNTSGGADLLPLCP